MLGKHLFGRIIHFHQPLLLKIGQQHQHLRTVAAVFSNQFRLDPSLVGVLHRDHRAIPAVGRTAHHDHIYTTLLTQLTLRPHGRGIGGDTNNGVTTGADGVFKTGLVGRHILVCVIAFVFQPQLLAFGDGCGVEGRLKAGVDIVRHDADLERFLSKALIVWGVHISSIPRLGRKIFAVVVRIIAAG